MIQHPASGAVKVKRDGPRGWHWIAAAAFDPARHELVVEPEAPEAAAMNSSESAPAASTSPDPAARKPRAAKTPHRKEAAHGDR